MISAELSRISAAAAANQSALLTLCEGLTGEQLLWREQPTRWSIAENLVHLSKTVELCVPAVEKAITDARRQGKLSNGPFKQGILGRIFVWYAEPPPKLRVPAPKPLLPKFEGCGKEALSEYLSSHQKMLKSIEAANGVDLRRARFQSPFASFVKMDLLALFSVWTAHERRHIEQAKGIRAAMGA